MAAKRRWPGCVLCRIWEILEREKTPEGDPCVVIPGHIARKPDPCIYDQFLLMQLGKPVTWDNPDVRIFLNGVEQYTYNLTVGTTYDVEVTVHNSSRDKPANGTAVDIRWIEFGAGGQVRHLIAVAAANVPVWPGTDVVTTKWTTPDTPGHYCIEVELSHPDDGNPSNNRGWNNTQVYAAQSPVARDVRIFNRYPGDCPKVEEGGGPWLRPHRVFLGWAVIGAVAALLATHAGGSHADMAQPTTALAVPLRGLAMMAVGYAAGAVLGLLVESVYAWIRRRSNARRARDPRTDRTDCHLVRIEVDSYRFEDKTGKDFDPMTAFTGVGPLWNARVTPSSFVFQPGEAYRDVLLEVDAPDDAGPDGHFNVNVWQGGVPSGGVTLTVTTGG
ncbi:hypothetical protein [Hoeflea marina]|uniref:hypothetical protein n=1 Tax=Hoeflea marina TaxID=274592 RepID=UPI000D7175F3|nr:hypothetical protein [Hoeflea marina]